MFKDKKVIIFDMDGTLIDSVGIWNKVDIELIKELGESKEQCLIFEDSLIGIEAANNAGIDVVAMYDKYSDMEREEIERKATYSLKNYEEAIQILIKENI